jgi:hypothetical protein
LAHKFGEPVEKWPLASRIFAWAEGRSNHSARSTSGNSASFRFWGPFDFEGVASYGLDLEIAFGSECNHPLAATLATRAD